MTYLKLYIRNLFIFTLAMLVVIGVVMAQDNDTPPDGYLDSCNGNPTMFRHFGTYCIQPVRWNQPAIIQQPYETYRIDTWVWFDDNGAIRGGVIEGYWWDFREQRYYYYVTTSLELTESGLYAEVFEAVPPERIVAAQEAGS